MNELHRLTSFFFTLFSLLLKNKVGKNYVNIVIVDSLISTNKI